MEHINRTQIMSMAQFKPDDQMQAEMARLPREFVLRVINPSSQRYVDQGAEMGRSHPRTVVKKASKYKLFQFFEDGEYAGKPLVYTYDFGDNWRHTIHLEGRSPVTENFKCTEAHGHYVAEDVGSTRGWEGLKAAYRASNPTKEQKERRVWYETACSNGEKEGLAGRENEVDTLFINLVLDQMRSTGLTNDGRRNPYGGGDTALPAGLAEMIRRQQQNGRS